MRDEDIELTNLKAKYFSIYSNAYLKVTEKKPLDSKVYMEISGISILVNEFINTPNFMQIYSNYKEYSIEDFAILVLKNFINFDIPLFIDEKEYLWQKYNESYKNLIRGSGLDINICIKDEEVKKLLNVFEKTEIFKKIYDEAKTYYNKFVDDWVNNKSFINKFLKKVLKIDVNIIHEVYITHPKTNMGCNLNNKIIWGHTNGILDSNYNIVYLVHEGLHLLLPPIDNTEDGSNINHAIIELISDYELYSLLSKKSTFKEGHEFLEKYKMYIYNFWLHYIGLNKKEIDQRYIFDNVLIQDEILDDLSNINIKSFEEYCVKKYSEK